MLRRLYELSASFEDPRRIPEMFSEMGPMAFFEEIMGPMAPVLRRDIHHSDQEIRDAMMEGIRLAQDLCYCRNWSEYKEVSIKEDPFGRSANKVWQQMTQHLDGFNPPGMEINFLNEGSPAMPAFPEQPEGHFDDMPESEGDF
jgi:hypothetical protein